MGFGIGVRGLDLATEQPVGITTDEVDRGEPAAVVAGLQKGLVGR